MALQQISDVWATYLRVSDEDKQTPERSFAMQRQRIQEQLLLPSHIPLGREYTDLLSGTNPNRKDYQRMLSDAEAGKFSHLGLYRADRFGRNTIEGLQSATKLIGLGVKIRVANMPSLRPEEPDGFFMFLLQMGLAQREVDVLAQRTADGMEAKLRKGGWPQKAPEGYVNKERQIVSGKYERWIEQDPGNIEALRLAWQLLLANRFTLDEICEQLAQRGFVRSTGRPWAWNDPKTGKRMTAKNRLHQIFHNPFYAGWAVSKRFGIKRGEVRGTWEPIITTEQFERGEQILLKHGDNKSRFKRQPYLLRNLLWVQEGKSVVKMYGSTPTGYSQSYSYYVTHIPLGKKALHIPVGTIDCQIPGWLARVTLNPVLIPEIREVYRQEIRKSTQDEKAEEIERLNRKLTALNEEEARLGRLFMEGKISEDVYDQLRGEWQEKTRNIRATIKELEVDVRHYLDDLEVALILLTNISTLYPRLDEKKRTALLQVLAKRIIVDRNGKIISHELHSPFEYLSTLASELVARGSKDGGRSSCVSVSTPAQTRTVLFGSGGRRSIH